jgi:sugar phosphate isomerase/epimerase
MKYSICNETYGDWSLEKTCEDIASHGYDGVEIAPFTLDADPRNITEKQAVAYGNTVRSFGLQVTGLHWLLSKPNGLHISTANEALRRESVDFAKHTVMLNAAMQGEVLVYGSPMTRNVEEGMTYEQAWKRATDSYREIAQECEKLGGILVLEPLGHVETNFLTSAEEGIKMIKDIGSDSCKLHLDVKAMSYEDKAIDQIIRDSKEYFEHFHANDPNLCGPGTGEVKYEPIYQALGDINYNKWVSIEVFKYEPDAQTIAREGIEFLKKMESEILNKVGA